MTAAGEGRIWWDPRGTIGSLSKGGTSVTGGNKLGIDSSELSELSKKLRTIISDVGSLSTAVETLTTKLKAASGAWKGLGGAPGAVTSIGTSGNLSTASFGTPMARSVATTAPITGPGGGVNAGSTVTVAPISFMGGGGTSGAGAGGAGGGGGMGAGRMVGLYAAGEIGSQWAGQINTGMANLSAAGMPTDLMARQAQNMYGGAGGVGTAVSNYTGFFNQSPTDLNQAIAQIRATPFLQPSMRSGSRSQKNLMGFVNSLTVQGMSATQAATLASQLTSGPALHYFQRTNFAQGGIINPHTLQAYAPQKAWRNIINSLDPMLRNASGAALKAQLGGGNAYKTAQNTALIEQNAAANNLSWVTPQLVTSLQQYAASEGNVRSGENSVGGTQFDRALQAQTAGTAYKLDKYQRTNTARGWMYDVDRWIANTKRTVINHLGPIPNILAFGSGIVGKGLGAAAHVAEGSAMVSALGSIFGGAAGTAGSAAGGAATGGVMGALKKALGLGGLGTGGSGTSTGGPPAPSGAVQQPVYVRNVPTEPLTVELTDKSIKALCGCGSKHGTRAAKTGGGSAWDAVVVGAIEKIGEYIWKNVKAGRGPVDLPGDAPVPAGDPPTGATTTAGLAPNLSTRVRAMMSANPNLKITSGHRTAQQQSNLYAMKGGKGVAKPGHSLHQRGMAADIGPPSQFKWIARNAQKFGLYRPAPKSEPWHVQAMGDPTSTPTVTGSQVVSVASTALGVPYAWGGESMQGFDCSGLVAYVFGKLGIKLPHYAASQAKMGTAVKSLSQAQPGDLLFYAGSDGTASNPGHVTIYIGGGKEIAAPYTGQVVRVEPVTANAIVAIRRIVSGGQGQAVVAAAQQTVGQPSHDSHGGSGGTVVGLSNTFLSMVQGSWLSGGGPAGAGGATSAGSSSSTSAGGGSSAASATSTGGAVSLNVGSINTPTDFSKAVLSGLGIAGNMNDITDINAWQQQEGQWGAKGNYNATVMHDPLNTKLPEPGSVSLGGLTNSYPTWAEGVQATVSTIKQGNMAAIYAALKSGANLATFSKALESTPWASSAYEGRSFPMPSGVYATGDPVGNMGDPALAVMSPTASMSSSGMPSFSRAGGGHGPITVNMPIQVVGVNQQDAQMLANMVMQALKSADENAAIGSL